MPPEVSPNMPPKMTGFPPKMGTPEASRARIRKNFGGRGLSAPPNPPPKIEAFASLRLNFGGCVAQFGGAP